MFTLSLLAERAYDRCECEVGYISAYWAGATQAVLFIAVVVALVNCSRSKSNTNVIIYDSP